MYGYLEPREVPEGEREITKTVYCQNENCADLDKEIDADLLVSYADTQGWATYTCPTCGKDSEHNFELSDEDFGFDPDQDWRSDK